MFFKEVLLRDFRNIENLQAKFSENLNIFLGQNGQGKTNLLESMYLALTGTSFRYSDLGVFVREKQNRALFKTTLVDRELDYQISYFIEKNKKQIFINGKKTSTAQISSKFHAVLFSPESLSAIKEGAEFRRHLVDELLITVNPNNAALVADYKKALKARNRLLKRISVEPEYRAEGYGVLQSINPIFLKLATRLTNQRLLAIREIEQDLSDAMKYISNENVDISVDYVVSGQSAKDFTEKEVHVALYNRLINLQEAEIKHGASLVGPHKHDIVFLYNQKDSRIFCSQGQQRALILSFKMAQIVYHRRLHGNYPVLMLDDVLSELDEQKRAALIEFLLKIKTQIFITTTDLNISKSFYGENCKVFSLKNGSIEQVAQLTEEEMRV